MRERTPSSTPHDATPGDERPGQRGHGGARELALLVISVPLVLGAFRVLFPVAYTFGERTSFVTAGMVAVALFAVPPLTAPALRRLLGGRASLLIVVPTVAVARLVVQSVRPVPLWLAAVLAAAALVTLGLLITDQRVDGGGGGRRFVLGLLVGMALDTAVFVLFGTWEPSWQPGILAAAAGAGLALLAVAAAWLVSPDRRPPTSSIGATAVLGPFLMLHVLFLQNVAFTASAAGTGVPAAGVLVLVGNFLAVGSALWVSGRTLGWAARLALGMGLVVLVALVNEITGPLAAVVLVAAQPLAAALLTVAYGRHGRAGWARMAVGLVLASLGFILLTLLFYLHYDIPLPFPNVVLAPFAAALLGLAAIREAPGSPVSRRMRAAVAAPAVLLVAPLVPALATPPPAASLPPPGSATVAVRVVDYNVHTAVNVRGRPDPEAVARVIEAQRPDVVTLQEVGRGWVVSGGTDVAEWLSHRLDMPYAYMPAADRGFGNAILSRFPIIHADGGYLPKGNGPMDRSWVRTVLDLGGGRTLTVIGVHLHHRHDGPRDDRTRLEQIGEVLSVWGGAPRTVIAGDMNATPRTDELSRFEAAGFQPAGDLVVPTWPSVDPRDRIDHVLATPDLRLSDAVVPQSLASDHLPVAATVHLAEV